MAFCTSNKFTDTILLCEKREKKTKFYFYPLQSVQCAYLGDWYGNGTSKLVLANQITYYQMRIVYFLTRQKFDLVYFHTIFHLLLLFTHRIRWFFASKFVSIALQFHSPNFQMWKIYRNTCRSWIRESDSLVLH